jgi:7 transmembrane receptor (rhodopsin family)
MLNRQCNRTDVVPQAALSADCLGDEVNYDDKNRITFKPDAFDADYVFYATDLDAMRGSWSDDRAFYPSTITYGLAFVVGLTGNLLVVIALMSDRKSRNVTSTFMISLAIADLVFLLVCVPYEAANKFVSYWAGGLALCKLAGFVEMLSGLASVLNLTAVSVER